MNRDDILPHILHLPDDESILRQVSDPVEPDDDWKGLLTRLEFAMVTSKIPGVGLSAIQIGIPARCFIALIKGHLTPFINPVITRSWGSYEAEEEACLSCPGKVVKVQRWGSVQIKPLQFKGKESPLVEFHGFEARIIQHEMDHLRGVLILDK